MERLDLKSELIKDTLSLFNSLRDFGANAPKSIVKCIERSICRDLRAGLRIINKKVPVYIELPNYKEEGSGQYSCEYDNIPAPETKEIITTPVVIENKSKQ